MKNPPLKKIIIGAIIFGVLGILLYLQDRQRYEARSVALVAEIEKQAPPSIEKENIYFEVLRRWTIGQSGLGMEILVSPNSTKEDVLSLSRSLVQKNRSRGRFLAMIFDSREAWANLNNDSYPEKEFYLHKLVHIMVPPFSGSQEITWTAENRVDKKVED